MNSLMSLYSGTPFSVTTSGNSLRMPGSQQTADHLKDHVETLGAGRGTPWFDPFAFCASLYRAQPGAVRNQRPQHPARSRFGQSGRRHIPTAQYPISMSAGALSFAPRRSMSRTRRTLQIPAQTWATSLQRRRTRCAATTGTARSPASRISAAMESTNGSSVSGYASASETVWGACGGRAPAPLLRRLWPRAGPQMLKPATSLQLLAVPASVLY
jgi:hypothetical protein